MGIVTRGHQIWMFLTLELETDFSKKFTKALLFD